MKIRRSAILALVEKLNKTTTKIDGDRIGLGLVSKQTDSKRGWKYCEEKMAHRFQVKKRKKEKKEEEKALIFDIYIQHNRTW